MTKHITSLDRIRIESPCKADWDSMAGNDKVRFCEHCNLSVHNLSEMTRHEALRLVRNSNGRLCVRYVRRAEDVALPVQLYRVTRRASRFAAGAFTAVLSLAASAAAQTPSPESDSTSNSVEVASNNAENNRDEVKTGLDASLAGTVKAPNGAVIPGATVTIKQITTQLELVAFSNTEGEYSFQSLAGGIYVIKAVAPGFDEPFEFRMLIIPRGEERHFDVTMGERASAIGGAMAVVAPSSPLVAAAFDDELNAVKELLFKGEDVNQVDKDVDATALDEAVSRGNLEMVSTLIDAGADVNQRNNEGQTALMFLTEGSNAAVVRALVEAGADVNLKDDKDETALMSAAGLEDSAILQMLLEKGADVKAVSKSGSTALMAAAGQGVAANVRALITAGADINAQDEDGETALKKAVDGEYTEVVQLLISFGAAVDAEPDDESPKR